MDFKEENSDFLSKMRIDLNLNTPWINIFISRVLILCPVNYLAKLKTLWRNLSRS